MVPSFYDNGHPFTRKEFQAAREKAETRVNNSTENQLEMVHANMEINEGVISDINANDLPVTKEVSINATLSPDDDFDLNSPIVVKVSTNTSNKGEVKTKETKLTSDSITP